ncbi:response regulator [Bradyrhizobium sp.]|uniref:response regulator n=1 Tax=Bradyrhizobium sp. TaxID=376 RepID=UPI0007C97032|nr:response regulator [Bradyrhizobium sp.]
MDPRKLRVLIVEDEFFIALDAEEQVKSLGHSVVGTAVSAEQAIRLAGEEKPDLVLMDIRLIGPVDGITAAQEIRSRYGVEAIFVTANTDPSTLARAESIEPLAVLRKPLTKDRLAAQLARLLTK